MVAGLALTRLTPAPDHQLNSVSVARDHVPPAVGVPLSPDTLGSALGVPGDRTVGTVWIPREHGSMG